jgi:hypothetical protein
MGGRVSAGRQFAVAVAAAARDVTDSLARREQWRSGRDDTDGETPAKNAPANKTAKDAPAKKTAAKK